MKWVFLFKGCFIGLSLHDFPIIGFVAADTLIFSDYLLNTFSKVLLLASLSVSL